jgi:hypothetical protein
MPTELRCNTRENVKAMAGCRAQVWRRVCLRVNAVARTRFDLGRRRSRRLLQRAWQSRLTGRRTAGRRRTSRRILTRKATHASE